MKLTTGILVVAMAAGTAWAQNPDVIDNTRSTMKSLQQKQQNDSNAALAAGQEQPAKSAAPAAKPSSTPAAAPAKPAPVQAKPATVQAKPVAAKPAAPQAKIVTAQAKPASKPAVVPAHVVPQSAVKAQAAKAAPAAKAPFAPKVAAKPAPAKVKAVVAKKSPAQPVEKVAVEAKKSPVPEADKKPEAKAINLTGRRDPFVSPVVNRSMVGSGCSTGKRCLAIDQINLKGVVRSENGMIAVVVNALDKAYFLRENDPVFNGYVVRITGDSIIFKETVQDKLGKPFTREVTKKISTPAV